MKWKFKFGSWRLQITDINEMTIWNLISKKSYKLLKNKGEIVEEK